MSAVCGPNILSPMKKSTFLTRLVHACWLHTLKLRYLTEGYHSVPNFSRWICDGWPFSLCKRVARCILAHSANRECFFSFVVFVKVEQRVLFCSVAHRHRRLFTLSLLGCSVKTWAALPRRSGIFHLFSLHASLPPCMSGPCVRACVYVHVRGFYIRRRSADENKSPNANSQQSVEGFFSGWCKWGCCVAKCWSFSAITLNSPPPPKKISGQGVT